MLYSLFSSCILSDKPSTTEKIPVNTRQSTQGFGRPLSIMARPQPRGANPRRWCAGNLRERRDEVVRGDVQVKYWVGFLNRGRIWRASQPMTQNLRHDGPVVTENA